MLERAKNRYPYILLAAAAAVLGLGLLLKPVPPEHRQEPSESELLRLQRLTQRRRLRDLSSYLTDAADAAAFPLVRLMPGNRSGVLWDSGLRVVTAAIPQGTRATQPWTAVTDDRTSIPLQAVPLPPGAPFAVFSSTAAADREGAALSIREPQLGDWSLAIGRNGEGGVVYAHGIYQGVVQEHCGDFEYYSVQTSAPLSAALAGGGVFTLDGQLLGVISECYQTPIVVAVKTISSALSQPASMNRQLEDLYGIRVADAGQGGARKAARPGLTVVAVWRGSLAWLADLQTGDVILAADGKPAESRADLETLIARTDADHELTIRRGYLTMKVTLTPAAAPRSVVASNGLTLRDQPDGGVVVSEVAAGSVAAQVGIRAGDAVTRVGSETVDNAEDAARALHTERTAPLLTLERDGREYEALLKHE
ncbi:MAG: PDZ domain-containing protein [Acidobacteriota bacterium]|nr:PDZ domain-containing protein [Acidobacteriota bacterium]